MSGLMRHYLLRSGALALVLAVLLTLIFLPRGTAALLFAAIAWAPMALIGVAGGGWTVSRFGRVGVGFPLAVLTCILLRLLLGLGGLAFAHVVSSELSPQIRKGSSSRNNFESCSIRTEISVILRRVSRMDWMLTVFPAQTLNTSPAFALSMTAW